MFVLLFSTLTPVYSTESCKFHKHKLIFKNIEQNRTKDRAVAEHWKSLLQSVVSSRHIHRKVSCETIKCPLKSA